MLACAEDVNFAPLTAVGDSLGVSREMVGKRRVRFAQKRLKGLTDVPLLGAPRKITDEQVEAAVTRCWPCIIR